MVKVVHLPICLVDIWDRAYGHFLVSGETLEHNWPRYDCFQVQPVTC